MSAADEGAAPAVAAYKLILQRVLDKLGVQL